MAWRCGWRIHDCGLPFSFAAAQAARVTRRSIAYAAACASSDCLSAAAWHVRAWRMPLSPAAADNKTLQCGQTSFCRAINVAFSTAHYILYAPPACATLRRSARQPPGLLCMPALNCKRWRHGAAARMRALFAWRLWATAATTWRSGCMPRAAPTAAPMAGKRLPRRTRAARDGAHCCVTCSVCSALASSPARCISFCAFDAGARAYTRRQPRMASLSCGALGPRAVTMNQRAAARSCGVGSRVALPP